ncbi:MAG: hypothetical protein JXA33_03380 [Anaerolineae bacterium]|nr:hypothetical protein [Anaerolineae bacterium]
MDLNALLTARGPCTGAELLALSNMGVFPLWQACRTQPDIVMRHASRRYLRLDKRIAGYARLSPSIRREFLTYTIVGTSEQSEEIIARCLELQQEFVRISQYKHEFIRDVIQRVVEYNPNRERLRDHLCCMIAGDVTYGMAHTVERPELSTGRPVRGSDLDVIIVADEHLTTAEHTAFDEALYREKWNMLVLPQIREEIDYIIKDVAKVMTQLQFDSFRHMVACKILHESEFLYGNAELFIRIKHLVNAFGIAEKLARMEDKAIKDRETVERQLVGQSTTEQIQTWQPLFFTSEEREEIH